jgi:hypothetical protein
VLHVPAKYEKRNVGISREKERRSFEISMEFMNPRKP